MDSTQSSLANKQNDRGVRTMRRLILLAFASPSPSRHLHRNETEKQKKQDKSSLNLIKTGLRATWLVKTTKELEQARWIDRQNPKERRQSGACLPWIHPFCRSTRSSSNNPKKFKKKGRGKGGTIRHRRSARRRMVYAEPIEVLPDDEWFILSADVALPNAHPNSSTRWC